MLAAHYQPRHSPLGIAWTLVTAVVIFVLAAGKETTGRKLDNPVLRSEGRVTFVDGVLATAVLVGAPDTANAHRGTQPGCSGTTGLPPSGAG